MRMNVKNDDKRKYRVIIIGAGAAGLSAADSLVKNGIIDFILLEVMFDDEKVWKYHLQANIVLILCMFRLPTVSGAEFFLLTLDRHL